MPLLSTLTFLPLLGALVLLGVSEQRKSWIRAIALTFSGLSLIVSLVMACQFDSSLAGLQFAEKYSWIPAFNISYHVGVDGLSMPLLVLTTLLSFLAFMVSFSIQDRIKEYYLFFLLLETAMLGVFIAMDLFLFYVFWEITLVPMYFLIGIWGGAKKEYAAIKFILYTLFGSLLMLVAILALYFHSSPRTFDLLELMQQNGAMARSFQIWVFLGFFIGFAVKIPAFPFHTWLPLAHVEAPTAVSVILAGVLLKMGTYGLMRFSFPLLPDAARWFADPLMVIAVINVVYGALCSMVQTDIKRMIAYSSISHMGYCLMGMASLSVIGFNGAVLQMVTHGIITGSLFMLVGVLYDRTHTRDIQAFGGLVSQVPVYGGLMIFACMASLGLPPLAGFMGEFLCFLGGFKASPAWAFVALLGIIFTACFFLVMIRKVFMGTLNPRWKELTDLSAREYVAVVPLAVLTVLLGVFPNIVLTPIGATIAQLASIFQ